MVVGSSVGTGVGTEFWRAFIQSFWMGMDDGSGVVVGWIFGTEAGVGWSRWWSRFKLYDDSKEYFVAENIHASLSLSVPS